MNNETTTASGKIRSHGTHWLTHRPFLVPRAFNLRGLSPQLRQGPDGKEVWRSGYREAPVRILDTEGLRARLKA
jgi:hypothetical protein